MLKVRSTGWLLDHGRYQSNHQNADFGDLPFDGGGHVPRNNHEKNGHLLGFIPHTYFCLFDPFTNICTLFRNNLLYWYFFLLCIFNYCTSSRVNYVIEFRGAIFIQTISAETARKIDSSNSNSKGKRRLIPWWCTYDDSFHHSSVILILC